MRIFPQATTTPTAIVTLDKAKEHCRITGSAGASEDAYIQGLIDAAHQLVEKRTGRAFGARTAVAKMGCFPTGWSPLELGHLRPLISVDSITYYDTDDTQQTLDAASYSVSLSKGKIQPRSKVFGWPATNENLDNIEVTLQVGGPANAIASHAALMLIGHWYENREEVIVGSITSTMPIGADRLLNTIKAY